MINLLLHTLALTFARAAMWCSNRLIRRRGISVIVEVVRDDDDGVDYTVN